MATILPEAFQISLIPVASALHPKKLFPATISEGLDTQDDLEPQRLFLRHCFPELAAQGLLIDPSRTGIRTTNEKICCAVTVLIVVLCILAFGDYELFWAD